MSTAAGMEFRISDTFTDSLARLAGEEQKAAKTAAFDLQLNPAQPGLQFDKLEKANGDDTSKCRAESQQIHWPYTVYSIWKCS